VNMKYTSDSDVSDGTRDLVRQGLASVKRKRVVVALQPEHPSERLSVSNMDTSHILHPLYQDGLIGAASTRVFSTPPLWGSMNPRDFVHTPLLMHFR